MTRSEKEIREILARGPEFATAMVNWKDLTAGDALFKFFQTAKSLPDEEVESLAVSMERWCRYMELPEIRAMDDDDAAPPWMRARVRALAACVRAARWESREPLPPWEQLCVRFLREDVPLRGPEVHVAMAAWNQTADGPDAGLLATLWLQVLDGGSDVVAQDPADVCTSLADAVFVKSMQNAWDWALARVRSEGVDVPPVDGRWRATRDGQPMLELTGGSAGAAAFRGWYYALRNRIPDDGVVVIAQLVRTRVHASGEAPEPARTGDVFEVRPVDRDGIGPKVRAIVASGECDTIVVASENLRHLPPDVRDGHPTIKVVALA